MAKHKYIKHVIISMLCLILICCGILSNARYAYAEYYDPNGPAMTSGSLAELREIGMAEKAAGTPYSDQNGTPVYVNPSTGQYSYSYFEGATKVEGYDYSSMGGSSGGTNTAPSSGSGQKGNASQGQAAQKQYPHDFDYISDDAQEALVYFTKDGKPDSAYINLPMSSSQNSVPGSVLRRSLDGKEDLIVHFIEDSEDGDISKAVFWRITEMDVADDYEIDLTTIFERDIESEYDGTYRLIFTDKKAISDNNLIIGLYDEGFEEAETYRLYTSTSDGGYNEVALSAVSENTLSFPITELTEYILSRTDIIAEQQKKAAEMAEAAKQEEIDKIDAASEVVEQDTEPEQPNIEEANTELQLQADSASTKNTLSTEKILTIGGIVLAIILIVIFVRIRKKKNK